MTNIIGLLHFLATLVINLYAFLFAKNRFDFAYILFMMSVVISWTFYNGECWISYYEKKKKDPEYVAGTLVDDLSDINELVGVKNAAFVRVYYLAMMCANALSLYFVLLRNSYPVWLSRVFCSLFIFYVFALRFFPSWLYHPLFSLIFIVLSGLLLYVQNSIYPLATRNNTI